MSEPYSYPRAGHGSVPAVARAVESLLGKATRRGVPLRTLGPSLVRGFFQFLRRLPNQSPAGDKTQTPGLYLLLGTGTSPLKMSKQDAAYQSRPVGQQRCGNCSSAYRQVVTDDLICSQVEGTVDENGWSRLWNTDRN